MDALKHRMNMRPHPLRHLFPLLALAGIGATLGGCEAMDRLFGVRTGSMSAAAPLKETAPERALTEEPAPMPIAREIDLDAEGAGEELQVEGLDGQLTPVIAARAFEDGLLVQVLREGSGEPYDRRSAVIVHYVGMLEEGVVFDTTAGDDPRGPWPLTHLIRGWQQGLDGMRIGEIRRLVIPAELAYGASGVRDPAGEGFLVPPDSTLIFVVELMGIAPSD